MPEPIAFFGQRIEGGGEIAPIDALRDFVITNIAFAEDVKGNARAVVKVHHTILPGMAPFNGAGGEEDDEEEEEDEEEEIEEQSFVVAHLYPGKIDHTSVNLHFSSEELISFSVSGDNAIELIGNYVASPLGYDEDPDSEDDGYSNFDDSDEDEEIDSDAVGSLPELKRRIGSRAAAELENDDESEDEDFSDDGEIDLDLLGGEDSDEGEDDENRFEEIDDSKVSSKSNGAGKAKAAAAAVLGDTTKPSKKRSAAALEDAEGDVSMVSTAGGDATDAELAAIAEAEGLDIANLSKNQRKRLNKKLRASTGEAVAPPKAAEKKTDKAAPAAAPAAAKEAPGKKEKEAAKKVASKKQKLPSGVEIEDIKVGNGPAAKPGNKLGMRYIGRLTNGKQFDSNTSGKPFGFKLGRGEVIKGWDEGLRGMQVGGERRLTIPPASAYGSSGAPPTIPRNATLVFDVKLVEIK